MKLKLLLISFLFFFQTNAQIDTIPPIITLLGLDTVVNGVFVNYIDAGATAFDLKDGNVAVYKSGVVNVAQIGQYLITYTAHDSAGNQAKPKTRVVMMKDTISPKIVINGPNPVYFCLGSSSIYTDQGHTTTDNYDIGISASIFSNVDPSNYGIYKVIYFAKDQSGNVDTAIRSVIVTGNCAFGQLYFDKNSNCKFDSLELSNRRVKILFKNLLTKASSAIFPDYNGRYFVGPSLDTGDYLVQVISLAAYLKPTCGADSFTYKHLATTTKVKDIPFFDTLFTDLSASLRLHQNHRWGFDNAILLYLQNEGTVNEKNLKVALSIPVGTSIQTAYPSYDSISNNKVYWHFDSLIANDFKHLDITYKVDTAKFQLNDTIQFILNVVSSSKEIDTTNNILNIKKRVVGAYDPNEKYCTQPPLLKPAITNFDYSVVFQNTGNAEAFEVVVRDTIDNRFDINSLKVIEASHQYNAFIKNNILTVRFEGINLPDSHTNEPKSHGSFSYSVNLNKPLSLNDEIRNTAYIYFDRNPAIITNTTLNKYVLSGITTHNDYTIGIYPNPANSIIRFKNTIGEKAYITDLLGNVLLQSASSSIDISILPSGVYLLRVGLKVAKLIKE